MKILKNNALEEDKENYPKGKVKDHRNKQQQVLLEIVKLEDFANQLASFGEHKAAKEVVRSIVIEQFNHDFDEVRDWIDEKHKALANNDLGKDLDGVQTLQRKHEGLELDLATYHDKIRQLDETANRLMQSHPDPTDQIHVKQKEINEEWQQTITKANLRKEKLLNSYNLQRFLSDYRALLAWIKLKMSLVSYQELTNDVIIAKTLIKHHQEYLSEIRAYDCKFSDFVGSMTPLYIDDIVGNLGLFEFFVSYLRGKKMYRKCGQLVPHLWHIFCQQREIEMKT